MWLTILVESLVTRFDIMLGSNAAERFTYPDHEGQESGLDVWQRSM